VAARVGSSVEELHTLGFEQILLAAGLAGISPCTESFRSGNERTSRYLLGKAMAFSARRMPDCSCTSLFRKNKISDRNAFVHVIGGCVLEDAQQPLFVRLLLLLAHKCVLIDAKLSSPSEVSQ